MTDGRASEPTAGRTPFLSARRIHKSYGPIRALDDVSVDLYEGEVHAIVGENGAGKSTLMKILAGEQAHDAGDILIGGRSVRLGSPLDAQGHGIAIVHQHFELVDSLTVAENLCLGALPRWRRVLPIIDRRRMRANARRELGAFGLEHAADLPVRDLTVAERQIVEIVKALARRARMLILDEPTSSLSATETAQLFGHIRRMRAEGATVVFIAHNIEEVLSIADRVTVLRDGRHIATQEAAELDPRRLVQMIVGRTLAEGYPKPAARISGALLEVAEVPTQGGDRWSVSLRRGEILGYPTFVGSPVDELLERLSGQARSGDGEIKLEGRDVARSGVRERILAGICLVPGDATAKGLMPKMSIRDNILLPSLRRFQKFGFIDRAPAHRLVDELIAALDIRPADPSAPVENLSGGNRQKVVIAKWLAAGAKVLVMDDPTKGVDVGAKIEIYRVMADVAMRGGGIVLASSDLDELIGLADRIIVAHDGERHSEHARGAFDKGAILAELAGGAVTIDAA